MAANAFGAPCCRATRRASRAAPSRLFRDVRSWRDASRAPRATWREAGRETASPRPARPVKRSRVRRSRSILGCTHAETSGASLPNLQHFRQGPPRRLGNPERFREVADRDHHDDGFMVRERLPRHAGCGRRPSPRSSSGCRFPDPSECKRVDQRHGEHAAIDPGLVPFPDRGEGPQIGGDDQDMCRLLAEAPVAVLIAQDLRLLLRIGEQR